MSVAEATQLVKTAEQSLAAGDHAKAVESLKEALRLDASCFPALKYLALLRSMAGEFSEAVAHCERALKLQPNDLEVIALLASSYLKMHRLAEAAAYYRRAIALNPNVAQFHENLGLALLHQAMDEAAEGPFQQAIALDPAHAVLSYSGLAQIQRTRGNLHGASELCRKAYEAAPGTALGSFALAQAVLLEGDAKEAEKYFREAIALQPNLDAAYRLLGQTLQQLGRFEEAEENLKKAIELDPNRGTSYTAITNNRKMTEEDRPFVELMRSRLSSSQLMLADQCALHFAYGKALNDLGEYESALKEFDQANALAAKVLLQGRQFAPGWLKAIYEHAATVYNKEFFVSHRHLGSESDVPIFILGMMRSGTTLIEQIVSSHPDVGAGGELTYWVEGKAQVFDPTGRIVNESKLKEAQEEYLEILRKIAPDKKHVTNKTPLNYNFLGVIHLAFPRAKIIHCKRDPVDTVLSIYMTPMTAPPAFGCVRENLVFAYKEYRRLMKLYKSVLPPESMLEVQYEDVVADQETNARRIVEFLGLEWNDACLHPEENVRNVNTPSMWQVRQPIYTSAVRRWKNYEPWLGAFNELKPKGQA